MVPATINLNNSDDSNYAYGILVDMKRGSLSLGYTLVEVLIFLAVSSALFTSAYVTFGGQQRKTQFATGMRDTELKLQDIINDVSTGYYAKPGNAFDCKASSAGPVIDNSAAAAQGTNAGCTFIGRAVQFGISGTNRIGYSIYDIVGLKTVWDTNQNVESLDEAKPVVLTTTPFTELLPNGLEVRTMESDDGSGARSDIGTVAFVSSLDTNGGSFTSQSGSQAVDLIPLNGSQLDQPQSDVAIQIMGLASVADKNPSGGVIICLTGTASNSYGLITIGGDRGRITTNSEIKSGSCP